MITNESIETVCEAVSEFSDEKMASEFDRFFKAQPAVCDFIVDLTSESTPAIQELSLFLSYMIFRAIEAGTTGRLALIQPEEIEAAFRESESWVEAINGADPEKGDPGVVAGVTSNDEPFLLQYILFEINQPLEDGSELPDEEKGEVFFLLKTVMASLLKSAGPRIIVP
jgi:hypothetical protein